MPNSPMTADKKHFPPIVHPTTPSTSAERAKQGWSWKKWVGGTAVVGQVLVTIILAYQANKLAESQMELAESQRRASIASDLSSILNLVNDGVAQTDDERSKRVMN